MGLRELLERALLEGYATSELNIGTMFLCIGITALIALYIFFVYRMMNKNSFYNRGFSLSLVELAVITAAIILTIQSNIVVSLGRNVQGQTHSVAAPYRKHSFRLCGPK